MWDLEVKEIKVFLFPIVFYRVEIMMGTIMES
jgi:hypothetical protein